MKTKYKIRNESIYLDLRYYQNRNTALVAYTEFQEIWGVLSVNIESFRGDMSLIAVDINNIPEAPEFLVSNNIAEDTGRRLQSGYVTYPVYKLTDEFIKSIKEGRI